MANMTVIEPPVYAQRDPHEYKYWLKLFGRRLIDAGLGNVTLRPMVKADGMLLVAVESELMLEPQIKQAAKAARPN